MRAKTKKFFLNAHNFRTKTASDVQLLVHERARRCASFHIIFVRLKYVLHALKRMRVSRKKVKKAYQRDLSQMIEKGLKRISRPKVEDPFLTFFIFFRNFAKGTFCQIIEKFLFNPG